MIYEWQLPTLNIDGTPIPANGPGSLISTRIKFGFVTGPGTGHVLEERILHSTDTSAVFHESGPGTYFAKAYFTNTHGQESIGMNLATKVVT